MSNLDKTNKHFNSNKKEHTGIKHYLFENILTKSISIANNLSKNKISSFVYIDLFAGAGTFGDNSYGSPMIAANTLNTLEKSNNNYFENIQIIAIDKEQSNIDKLKQTYYEVIVNSKILFNTYVGSWEDYIAEIADSLNKATWGFIFADPFSTELDIKKLMNTIKKNVYLKDILIFYNYNTLNRQNARNYESDKKRVTSTIGAELIDKTADFKDFFKQNIKNNLYAIKDYTIGVSFPVTRNNKLTNSDYFYLVFCTNSVKLSIEFISFYEDCLNTHSSYNPSNKIALLSLENSIEDYISHHRSISLFELIDNFVNSFFEWKNYNNDYEILPTTEKIIDIINENFKNNKISIQCNQKYKYVRQQKDKLPGMIKFSSINSKKDCKDIILINKL